jgi:hypothetical protein
VVHHSPLGVEKLADVLDAARAGVVAAQPPEGS